ncbi:MAG: lysophospholipase [Turicibacter sp.]|nr:lysophospholipase [Turicibacter sp.]
MKIFVLLCVLVFLPVSVYAEFSGFEEEPITVGDYELNGVLVMPVAVELPPVVIFVHGTGQTDMDSTFGGVAPFRDIAHGLGEGGVASIRFNKRFWQHPPIPQDMTIWTEILEDVAAAIEMAENDDRLGDIYLLGFSLGGILAPHIAYEHESVRGIISLAGSPRPFSEILVSQSNMLLYMYARSVGIEMPVGFPIGQIINFVLGLDYELLTTNEAVLGLVRQFGFPIRYLLSLREIDTGIVRYVDVPMLILHGEEDLQLLAAEDFAAWQEVLYGRENVQFILYEGLNHFFTPHVPELGYRQTLAEAVVDFRVVGDVLRWLADLATPSGQ